MSSRIDAFELWCWRRLFRIPWTARRSNQSILKEISPRCSLEGLMLKWRVDSLEKTWCWEGLGAGGEGNDRGWDGWMASPTWWTWVWVNSGSWWWTGRPGVLRFMGLQRVGHNWVTELNWTEHHSWGSPPHDLITSQRPYLLKPSYDGFQHMNFGGTHSVHSSCCCW